MSTVEHSGATADLQADIIGDQKRAERVAAEPRRRAALQNFVIRMISLAIFLVLWQVAAVNVDPVLFTTPWKVAVAAVDMLRTGELWNSLWPSLLVLLMGLSLAIAFGTLLGLMLARFRIMDIGLTVYITFLY